MKTPLTTYDELMKPTTMICVRCGGTLHVIPYEEKKGKKVMIKTMNICGKCSFHK